MNGTNQAVKMALDTNGNIYVTGFSQNTNTNLGYVTIKYAPNGTQLWAARYDSTNNPSAAPSALALDSSNDVLVTGSALTIKYDTKGNELWTASYAGTALAVDGNANVYVAGFSRDFGTVKLSAQGSNEWERIYTDVGPTVSQALIVDNSNDICVVGSDSYYCFSGGCYQQLLTIKYDPNGNQLWASAYNAGGPVYPVLVNGVAIDGVNNLYVLASFVNVFMEYETMRYSMGGSLVWNVSPDVNGSSRGKALALDAATNVILTGQSFAYDNRTSAYGYGTFKLNTDGSPQWTNYYPPLPLGSTSANAIAVDFANNSYVTGCSPGTNGPNDIVTIKYDPNGNMIWLQRYSSPSGGNAAGNAIAVDNNGNVYVTGYDTTSQGGTEIVTIKYSPVTLHRQSNGTVILKAQGSPGEAFDIEASADLLNWLDLGTVQADTNGLLQFDDTNAPAFPARFYHTTPQ